MFDISHIQPWAQVLTPVIFGITALYFGWNRYLFDKEKIRSERDTDIIKWSSECISTASRAEQLASMYDYSKSEQSQIIKWQLDICETLAKISSLVDQGRMFYPNTEHGSFGIHKETAYRGIRQKPLDYLLDIHSSTLAYITDNDNKYKHRDNIVENKKRFVSEVQSDVDPRRRLGFINKYANITKSKIGIERT